jgi:hypothetical protein
MIFLTQFVKEIVIANIYDNKINGDVAIEEVKF